MTSHNKAPLNGLRVVDFSKFLPGPYCTWMLGDLGAEVIKVENPRELAKQKKVFGWDKLSEKDNRRLRAQDIFNRNKQSVLLDLSKEDVKQALYALIKTADILVEDYRTGVMDAMGFGYDTLRKINPGLIYCSVTLCGHTGPYASKPGHDPIALAIAGALSRMGENKSPAFPGVPVADLLSGSNAVIGVLSAVIARQTTQQGQHVDIAMSDAAMALIANVLSRNPDVASIPEKGMPRPDSGIWLTQDGGYIVTTDMEPKYWQTFCSVIGRPEYVDKQLDATQWQSIKHDIASIMVTKTQQQWLTLFDSAGTQFAPVLSISEALQNEHNIARGMVTELTMSDDYIVTHIGNPIHLSDTPTVSPTPGTLAGAQTDMILASLGYTQAQISALTKENL